MGVAEGMRITGAHEELVELLQDAELTAKQHDLALELARLYQIQGGVHFFRAESVECLEKNHASLLYAQRGSSPEMEAQAYSGLGDAEYSRGRLISARRHYDQCLSLARKWGFRRIIAVNLTQRSSSLVWENDMVSAVADIREATEISKSVRDLRGEMMALAGGVFLADMGDIDEAKRWTLRALEIARGLQSTLLEGMCLTYLAKIALAGSSRALSANMSETPTPLGISVGRWR